MKATHSRAKFFRGVLPMNSEDWVGPVAAAAIVLFFTGFFVGGVMSSDSTNNKWCKRMVDVTYTECLSNGVEVTVVKK